jgi:hypothetical protein
MHPDRWFGVGSAGGIDAGARAVDDALRRDDAKLVIVFCSPSQDLQGVLRQIRTCTGDVPLIGCIARRSVLGEEGIQAETGRLARIASGAPVAGFYPYGEIARTRGVRGFHNQAPVVLSIA